MSRDITASGFSLDSNIPTAPAPIRVPARKPRLGLTGARRRFGPVDGAWWPYSRDAVAELPHLVDALDARLPERVTRVNVQYSGWDNIPRTLRVGDRTIRVGWFHSGDPHLITLTTRDRITTQLLVVPADTPHSVAALAMSTARSGQNAARPADILSASRATDLDVAVGRSRTASHAEELWDSEGGRIAATRRTGASAVR